ncbi:MAG: nitroreductase family deazaflavin-dependent oxidoreductase [Thermoleophilia bacterium]|nr:nitroreductase family deazaflavin-dependent oxidoreductase [Thermoleophilia bacterium]
MQQRLAATRAVAWVFAHTLDPIDSVLSALTGGRLTIPRIAAGLPVVFLTTTGAKSGRPRRVPLLSIPVAGNVAVLGTNYGQPTTPGWVVNLEADARARLSYMGRTAAVRARPVSPSELDGLFEEGARIYGGYAVYRSRIRGRRVRGFILEPADDTWSR